MSAFSVLFVLRHIFNLRSYKGQPTIFGGQSDCEHEWEKTKGAPSVVGTKTPKQVTNRGSYVPEGEAHTCKLCKAWKGKLGREASLQHFIANLVSIFKEVRRVLRPDGVLFVIIGDSFAGSMKGQSKRTRKDGDKQNTNRGSVGLNPPDWKETGLAHKNKLMVPWRLGLALQDDGWILRQDNIWFARNKMPTSAADRTTTAHEYVLHLSKAGRYYYDKHAVAEPRSYPFRTYQNAHRHKTIALAEQGNRTTTGLHDGRAHYGERGARNLRSVWEIPNSPYAGGHYAVFPPELPRRCILAGSPPVCCASCGAPWKRALVQTHERNERRENAHAPGHDPTKNTSTGWVPQRVPTDEFDPTCECHGTAEKQKYLCPVCEGEGVITTDGLFEVEREPCEECVGAGYLEVPIWLQAIREQWPTKRPVILDPFVGSGTTVEVAESLQRIGIGLDISFEYCSEHAAKRYRRGVAKGRQEVMAL